MPIPAAPIAELNQRCKNAQWAILNKWQTGQANSSLGTSAL